MDPAFLIMFTDQRSLMTSQVYLTDAEAKDLSIEIQVRLPTGEVVDN